MKSITVCSLPSGYISFIQRRLNVDATACRCIDVEATVFKRHVPAGFIYGER